MTLLQKMLSRRVVFVGQAPPSYARAALCGTPNGRSMRRLARLLGISPEEFGEHFGWVNLLGRWPGKSGKGDKWHAGAALMNAAKFRGALSAKKTPTTVFMLGYNVSEAFGVSGTYFCGSIEHPFGGAEVAFIVFPHPSGVSRWWNDARNAKEARRVLVRWTEESHGH